MRSRHWTVNTVQGLTEWLSWLLACGSGEVLRRQVDPLTFSGHGCRPAIRTVTSLGGNPQNEEHKLYVLPERDLYDVEQKLYGPAYYLADAGLRDAVKIALRLGQPLLLTGESGAGNTGLASSVAHELSLPPPLRFYVKATSTARDVFYRFDATRHFQDAQLGRNTLRVDDYITYDALGLAILLTMPSAEADVFLPYSLRGRGPTRSVVLIEDIDKAGRDLPNDLLDEIEDMRFTVAEIGRAFSANPAYRS
jgi:MoxR-like ATPase